MLPLTPIRIKSAAIFYNGVIYTGNSHADIGFDMIEKNVCKRPFPGREAQGFITEDGKFVSREEALEIAIESGQVVRGQTRKSNELFSEDLRK